MRPSPPVVALLSLTLTALACTTAEVPITPGGEMFTPELAPPTPTSPIPTHTPTVTRSPTPTIFNTPIPSATPFGFAAFPNGSFETDLASWTPSDPAQVTWQEGYARLAAGTSLQQLANVPLGTSLLHLRARSEDIGEGTCALDIPSISTGLDFLRDNQWYDLEFDVSGLTGLPMTVNPTAGGSCAAIHVDDVYWVVPPAAAPTTETPTLDPNATPAVDATASPTPTVEAGPTAIPPDAQKVQDFTVTNEGGTLLGQPTDMQDEDPLTWAALRDGNGSWVLALSGLRNVVGLTLYPQRVGNAETLLLGVDVSNDGENWTVLYTPTTTCGALTNCQSLTQGAFMDLPLVPTQAAFVRLRGGPASFGFAEIQVAILP